MLESSQVGPLQTLVYSFSDIAPALRQFSRALHIGKVVAHMPCPGGRAGNEEDTSAGSWVVTGGLGSLGLLTAQWLSGHGHAHIILLGRSGRWVSRLLALMHRGLVRSVQLG